MRVMIPKYLLKLMYHEIWLLRGRREREKQAQIISSIIGILVTNDQVNVMKIDDFLAMGKKIMRQNLRAH